MDVSVTFDWYTRTYKLAIFDEIKIILILHASLNKLLIKVLR